MIISPWSSHSGEPLVDSSYGLASRDILLLVCSVVFPVRASHVGECLAAVPVGAMAGVERPLVRLLLF